MRTFSTLQALSRHSLMDSHDMGPVMRPFDDFWGCGLPILIDFHNFIGAATKKYAPTAEPRKIIYRSYKNFNDLQFIDDVFSAPFQVAKIFDDVDDAPWLASSLLNDILDYHAPCKTKVVKCESVPYMNSVLHKALYKRNMARNKFRKYGKRYWEENRTHRNKVVSLRKKSIASYFS